MGCCGGGDDGAARTQEIDKQLARDKKQMRSEVKILLLGAGDSGKSTILKQMKLIHADGYSAEEKDGWKKIIYNNVLQNTVAVIDAAKEMKEEWSSPEVTNSVDEVRAADKDLELEFPPELAEKIKKIRDDEVTKKVMERAADFQLEDNTQYFFDQLDRLTPATYVPNEQDILRARVKTTGITETKFQVSDSVFRMFDVGGQRSERKKWIHCFENVTSIIFLVAISCYDQQLVEDSDVNRMQESLTLFDSICNSSWFESTPMILFLNKIDIFKEKLRKSPLQDTFPDYTGGDDYDKACDFITQRFVKLNKAPEKKRVYPHLTCATDTTQVKFVMTACSDIILQRNLREYGLI